MKVLIATGLYPPEIGGPATYSRILEVELPKRGIEVAVLAFQRVRIYPKIFRHFIYLFLVLRESWNADMIYAQDPVSVGVPAALAALFLRKKFMLKVVGDYAWEQATQRSEYTGSLESFQNAEVPFLPNILRLLERFTARQALRIVVPSKYLGRIVGMWGIPRKKISVIYNAVEEFGDTGNKVVLRGLLKFHGRLIVSVGRLVPWKGFMELIGLMPVIKKEFPDTKLLIIGGGPDMQKLEEHTVTCGVADDVIFTGPLERDILIRYLRASDVFVLNTAYEGFSHLLLETMAVGVPVVTTNVGGNVEVINHEKNGYLVGVNHLSEIKKYIGTLFKDAGLRMRIVIAAKQKAREFSNERMVTETATLLKKL